MMLFFLFLSELKLGKSSFIIADGTEYQSAFILNATYAGTNQILEIAGYEKFKIKYELCEIILCNVNDPLRMVGLTVMDGPFFSIMPFGKTGLHSLTSVTLVCFRNQISTRSRLCCEAEILALFRLRQGGVGFQRCSRCF